MNITIAKNEAEFDRMAAWRIVAAMLKNPKAVIGLSTGQTTINMHDLVLQIHKQHPFDVSGITLFGVDEVANVSREYEKTAYATLKERFSDILGIPSDNFVAPQTFSDDFKKECKKFQEALENRGGIDLQVLGLGENGHVGFNQPGTPFESETWVAQLLESVETRVRREANVPVEQELGGITLGIKDIMLSRNILLAAKGSHKAEIVKKILFGPITTDVPGSILQLHSNCEYLFDTEAAQYILDQI